MTHRIKTEAAFTVCRALDAEGDFPKCPSACVECHAAAAKITAMLSDYLRSRYGGHSASADAIDALMGVE